MKVVLAIALGATVLLAAPADPKFDPECSVRLDESGKTLFLRSEVDADPQQNRIRLRQLVLEKLRADPEITRVSFTDDSVYAGAERYDFVPGLSRPFVNPRLTTPEIRSNAIRVFREKAGAIPLTGTRRVVSPEAILLPDGARLALVLIIDSGEVFASFTLFHPDKIEGTEYHRTSGGPFTKLVFGVYDTQSGELTDVLVTNLVGRAPLPVPSDKHELRFLGG